MRIKPTRLRVLDAADTLIANSGYDVMSIDVLARASEASNGSIYHHFGSKEGVLLALLHRAARDFQRGFRDVLRAHPDDAYAGVRAAVRFHLEWAEARPRDARLMIEQWQMLIGGPTGRFALENREFLDAVGGWLAIQSQAGRMPPVGLEMAHALVFAPANELVRAWLTGRTAAIAPSTHSSRLGGAAWAALLAAGPD